jgi:endonuclease/exonuclease/phosphatase family metal-dependent hydrolase
VSTEAIEKSARLLAEVADRLGSVFIAGDFNAEIDTLAPLNEVFHNNVTDDTPTFVGFRSQKSKVIDTIYTSKPCERKVIIKKYNDYNPSDHHAVRVEIRE